jgi:4-amino-4-deoxy-L-arabinose transferase-like glycosyltransferase
MVLAGLIGRELGGSRSAQMMAALAVAIAPVSFATSTLFEYLRFDYLWWVVIAYLTVRLLQSDDPRWWLAVGAVIGLGMMTKYTMAFLVVGLVGGVVLTQARRHLANPWLWGGVALALAVFLPNLIWQVQHHFIALQFLSSIHARDVRIGRTAGYLRDVSERSGPLRGGQFRTSQRDTIGPRVRACEAKS